MQASQPQLYIHMNSKHCLELTVSLRCPNPFLYCTAPAQNKLEKPGPDASRKCLHISNNSLNPQKRASKGGDSDLHVFSSS